MPTDEELKEAYTDEDIEGFKTEPPTVRDLLEVNPKSKGSFKF